MPRFHVYTEARHPTGAVAAGHSLTVYDDAAGTITSSIYAAASGGSPLANPLVVPATGKVDFWATVPEPYGDSGDGVLQPLPILVATPTDIGAADVAKRNQFRTPVEDGGFQEIHGNLRLWRIGGEVAPQPVTAIYFAGETPLGLQPYGDIINMGIDANGFAILAYADHGPAGDGVDRLNIGSEPPNRIGVGGYQNANTPGGAQIFLSAAGGVATDPVCEMLYDTDNTGNVFRIVRVDGREDLLLDCNSNLHVRGNVTPQVSGAARAGDPAHGFQSVVLSDGTQEWMVTVDASGTLHTAKVRTNYVTNPRLKNWWDLGAPGYWTFTAVGAPTYTWTTMVVEGVARPALRVQYTGRSGDSSVTFACPMSPAGSLSNGDAVSASAYLVTNCVGVTVALYHQITATGQNIGPASVTIVQPSPTRFKVNGTASGAATNRSQLLFWISGVGAGDTIDFTIAAPMIEKAADAGTYFDGGDAGCAWAGLTDYSISKKG